ncbi:hypothetical protein COLO4_29312 [Corchorus olitorius]|uniref:Uncharacterized protein n=1 Tax=Corchorus olitorius TaxID=93759 RepID=A0A1R3HFH9_9ROSI|nr:hypothetical protein COLO4_29312 [Corchorus olitorius]
MRGSKAQHVDFLTALKCLYADILPLVPKLLGVCSMHWSTAKFPLVYAT